MAYQLTTATRKIARMTKRLRCTPGGTSAGKSISILLYLIARAQSDKEATLTSVVSESFPHLRRGVLKDFQNIMRSHEYWSDDAWEKSNSIYTFPNGSQFEFFSVDQGDKLRGARRDRLFINEANNVSFEAFEQLEVRTREFIMMDWNPSSSFFYYEEIKPKRDDWEELTLTYLDNEALDPNIVKSIESRRNRRGWWQVYGLGQLGEVEGRIYKDWAVIDALPHEAKLLRYGLDFGYTNDPTAIIGLYSYNGGYIIDEICFQKGLSNRQIYEIIKAENRNALVVADSSEPKSIDEIKSYGISIVGARKGKDSVRNGIAFVQDQRISVTKRSTSVLNEYRNYLWETDQDGKVLTSPEGGFDHSMDAIRYAFEMEMARRSEPQRWDAPAEISSAV
jgi:phage terminase large subunit